VTTTRLYLALEARPGAATGERLRAAVEAGDVASVLLAPAEDDVAAGAPALRALVAGLQARGIAAVVADDARLAATVGADGVHVRLHDGDDPAATTAAARTIVGAGHIVGVEVADGSRHAAMVAAETGADYVAFAGSDAADMVAWWAEMFEVPCVGVPDGDAPLAAAADAAAAGADFVMLALPSAQTAGDIAALVRACAAAVAGLTPDAAYGDGSGRVG
jgi:thiamine-phosphate pyrophosphorylase